MVNEKFGVAGPLGTVRAQQIPEGETIARALVDADHGCTAINHQCATIATQLSTYAAKIDTVHGAILDLLARICDPLTGIKEVWDILTDKDEDEIKKIANDIRAIVDNFTADVDALRHQITALLSEASMVVTTMGGYAAKQWGQLLHHTEVGRALNQVGQFGKGLGEEAGGLVKDVWNYSGVRAAIDPDGWDQSWKQLVDGMAPLVGLGGEHAPGVGEAWKDLGKEVTHWDEWKTNPAEAAGKSTFDVATLFAPGGIAGAAGKGGRAAADAAEAAAQAGRGEATASRALGGVAKSAPSAGAPAPAPHAPHIETPPTERSPSPPKPASASIDGQLPQGPTESKTPVTEKLRTGDTPAVPAESSPRAPEPPIGPREPVPVSDHPGPAMPGGVYEAAPTVSQHATLAGASQRVSSPVPHVNEHVGIEPAPADGPLVDPTAHESPSTSNPGISGRDGHDLHGGDGSGGGDRHTPGDGGVSHGSDLVTLAEHPDPANSHQESGDGWHRLSDEPRDPNYGEPLSDHWSYSENPADPSQIHPDVRNLVQDLDAPFGRDTQGHAYDQQQYEERFNKLGPDGQRAGKSRCQKSSQLWVSLEVRCKCAYWMILEK